MKKALLILTSVLVLGATAGAQEAFYPGWQFQVKGGVNYTAGETAFGKLLSPAVAVGAGYQFTPWFTLRGELSGWEGKGYLPLTAEGYKFNDIQLGVDGVFDICNIFKYRWARTVNPYLFAGIGGNLRFNNKEALAISQNFPPKNYLWENPTVCFMGRIGAGVDFRVSDAVKISLEFVDNILSDHFNSKVGGVKIGNTKVDCDFQLSALAGLKFCFGQAAKKAAADAAALAAAEAAAAKAAAEKAEAERLAAEKAAAEKAAAEKAAAEAAAKAAAEKAAAEKAAAEAAAKAAAHQKAIDDAIADPQKNIYFSIGKSYINSVESKKVKAIINTLKENPAAKITILGYADKNTGNPTINWPLSQKRAEAVKAALTKAGISEDRITTEFFGDTQQVSTIPAKNRVAVCVTE